MNGKELYLKLLETYPYLKVLYMSGYSSEVLNVSGIEESRDAFLAKPFSVASFLLKIRVS